MDNSPQENSIEKEKKSIYKILAEGRKLFHEEERGISQSLLLVISAIIGVLVLQQDKNLLSYLSLLCLVFVLIFSIRIMLDRLGLFKAEIQSLKEEKQILEEEERIPTANEVNLEKIKSQRLKINKWISLTYKAYIAGILLLVISLFWKYIDSFICFIYFKITSG